MNIPKITFVLEQHIQIICESETPLEELHCCSEEPWYFVHHNIKYPISRIATVRGKATALKTLLWRTLKGVSILPNSIHKDIGYLYNEYLRDLDMGDYDQWEKRAVWVGMRYYLMGGSYAAWLYNDEQGNIILEITPIAPLKPFEFDTAQEEAAEEKRYQEWIALYKPTYTGTIPRNTAQQWMEQAEAVVFMIDVINRNTTYAGK